MRTFRALGAFDPLFVKIATRYAAIRTTRFPERELVLSLFNLARVARTDGQLQQLVAYDLSRLDQRNSLAACSPASDNMGEIMLTGAYSDDEIERILSSGTSMDQQMMARVLRKIVSNLEEHVAKAHGQFESYSAWFHRLRSFDEPSFDVVLNEWLDSSFSAHNVSTLQLALPTLVGSGCLMLSTVLDRLQIHITKSKSCPSEMATQTVLVGLRMLLPHEELIRFCSSQDAYRYRLAQYKLCQDNGDRVVHCISEAHELGSSNASPKIQGQLLILMSSEPVLSLMKHCLLSAPNCLSQLSHEAMRSYVTNLFNTLLDPVGSLRKSPSHHICPSHCSYRSVLAKQSAEEQVLTIFGIASELSLPICQAIIEHIFSADATLSGESTDALSTALFSAIKTAVEEGQSAGLELLATLDASLTDKVSFSVRKC